MFMAALALMLALLSGDHSCGTIFRTPSRFRGTVRSVKMLTSKTAVANYADFDPNFIVTIEVTSVEPGVTAPRVGQRVRFAIHSPTLTFADGKPLARSFDLQAERFDCDDKFDRFIRLERRWSKPIVETLNGSMQVGHVYSMKATWNGTELDYNFGIEPPMHHDVEVALTNAGDFLVAKPEGVHEIVFEVTSLRITMTGERSWRSSYEAKILSTK